MITYLLLLRRRQWATIHTLGDRLAKQLLTLIRHEMQLDRASTRTLTIDGNLIRIPAETPDILLDPFKSLDLVQEARVEITVGCVSESRRCEEAERGKAVIYRHDDNIGALFDPVVERPIPGVAIAVT